MPTRREFLQTAAFGLPLAALCSFGRFSKRSLRVRERVFPILSDANIIRYVAGLRPYRANGIRVRTGTTLWQNADPQLWTRRRGFHDGVGNSARRGRFDCNTSQAKRRRSWRRWDCWTRNRA